MERLIYMFFERVQNCDWMFVRLSLKRVWFIVVGLLSLTQQLLHFFYFDDDNSFYEGFLTELAVVRGMEGVDGVSNDWLIMRHWSCMDVSDGDKANQQSL